MTFHHHYKVA